MECVFLRFKRNFSLEQITLSRVSFICFYKFIPIQNVVQIISRSYILGSKFYVLGIFPETSEIQLHQLA